MAGPRKELERQLPHHKKEKQHLTAAMGKYSPSARFIHIIKNSARIH